MPLRPHHITLLFPSPLSLSNMLEVVKFVQSVSVYMPNFRHLIETLQMPLNLNLIKAKKLSKTE